MCVCVFVHEIKEQNQRKRLPRDNVCSRICPLGGDTQPYSTFHDYFNACVCVFKVPGGGSSSLDRLSSDIEF